jgi:Tfp pilus assembly protein PilX
MGMQAAGGMSHGRAPHERGIALVVALVFLLMLTILGVTVMNTASLEGRMAGNTQEMNHAFHAAESAIEHVFTDGTIFTTLIHIGDTTTTTVKYPDATNPTATATVTSTYVEKKNKMPRARDRSNTDSVILFSGAAFDMNSSATTTSNANSTQKQGAVQAAPKSD